MLAETGILKPDQAKAIAKALAATETGLDLKNTHYTGEVEDLFFLIEHALKERLPADLAGRLHTGRSRNDIDHTLFKMVLKQRLDALLSKAAALARTLIDKAEAEKATIIVAYTHGQPAQPTTFGHYLGAAIEILLGDIERLQAARGVVDQCSMGAAAITTTGFPLNRARIAELLGFGAVRENSYGCIAAADYVTAPYSALKLMMIHLGRLIQDLQFWSSFEVGQLHVPDGYVQISSIMPQKRNPVPIEHARLLASLAAGRAETAIMTMHNTPFTDMNDSEGEVQGATHAAFTDAGRAIDLLAGLLRAARINADRVAINLDKSCATITELADSLVRREGLSFRQAHEIAAHVAREVVAAKTSLSHGYAPFREAFNSIVGRDTKLDEAEFREFVSPEYFIAVRDRFGGPAPAALAAAIGRYRQRLAGFEAGTRVTAGREVAAARLLDSEFAKLVG
jgi:argininosuccinate lyase